MNLWAGLADLLWPPRCSACDRETTAALCQPCLETLVECDGGFRLRLGRKLRRWPNEIALAIEQH